MSKQISAMKLALEALIAATPVKAKDPHMQAVAIVALQEALAEQPAQQEPSEVQMRASNSSWVKVDRKTPAEQLATAQRLMRNNPGVFEMRLLYTAPQTQQEPTQWQPIETAPKDGRMILVCLPRQNDLVVRAWYRAHRGFWLTDEQTDGGITKPAFFHEGDLWHPIPPVNKTTKKGNT